MAGTPMGRFGEPRRAGRGDDPPALQERRQLHHGRDVLQSMVGGFTAMRLWRSKSTPCWRLPRDPIRRDGQPGRRGPEAVTSSSGTTSPMPARRPRNWGSTRSRCSRLARRRVDPARLKILLNDHGLALAAVGTGDGVGSRSGSRSPSSTSRPGSRLATSSARRSSTSRRPIPRLRHHRVDAGEERRWGRAPDTAAGLSGGRPGIPREATPGTYGVPLLYEPLNRYETNLANTLDRRVRSCSVRSPRLQRRAPGRPVPHEWHRGDQPRRRISGPRASTRRSRSFRRLEPAVTAGVRSPGPRADRPGAPRDRFHRFRFGRGVPDPRLRHGGRADDPRIPP